VARARGRVARGNLWQQWALARGSHTGRPSGRAVRGEKVCRLPARENDTAALLVIGQRAYERTAVYLFSTWNSVQGVWIGGFLVPHTPYGCRMRQGGSSRRWTPFRPFLARLVLKLGVCVQCAHTGRAR